MFEIADHCFNDCYVGKQHGKKVVGVLVKQTLGKQEIGAQAPQMKPALKNSTKNHRNKRYDETRLPLQLVGPV